MNDERRLGVILDYDAERGHGKLRDQHDVLFFVHFRDIIDAKSLSSGMNVSFVAELHRKGNIAHEVQVL